MIFYTRTADNILGFTKGRLLDEALQKIKDIHDDSTEKTDTHTDNPDLD
jgi:hypothetical protein